MQPTPAEDEPALSPPDAWFRALFESAPVGMAVMSPQLRFHLVNPAFCRMLGRSVSELRGLRMPDVTHPDDLAASLEASRVGRLHGALRAEKRYVRPDGGTVWANVSGTRWTGPDGAHWLLLTAEDVTARREVEVRLREREAELGTIFEEAPFGMAINAPDGRFLKVNRAMCELVGHPAEALLAMTWTDLVHPLDREASKENLDKERAGADWEHDVVRRVVTRDGLTAWLRCKAQTVRDASGAARYTVGQFVDLTPARQHEEERRLLEEHLRRFQRTETVGRLAGGLVHDFNN
ncbi:MAG: PAS domain-containing protein, partial [Myxococcota bacterium]